MAINLRLSSSQNGTRNVAAAEQGGGQYLIARNLFSPKFGSAISARTNDLPASSTVEYYGMDGISTIEPYDLSQMGSPGAAVIAATGYRYVVFISCEHPCDNSGIGTGIDGGWGRDAQSVYAAFTNDPAIPPDPQTMRRIVSYTTGTVPGAPGGSYSSYFNLCFVYNPDDATYPFYLFVGSAVENNTGTNGLSMLLFGGADFNGAFTPLSESHPCGNGLTSYQRVYRNGTGDWYSYGGFNPNANDGTVGKWVSTDVTAPVFTKTGSATNRSIGNRGFPNAGLTAGGWKRYINGQSYVVCREQDDVNGGTVGNSGAYATLVAIDDSTGAVLSSPSPIRISDRYDGVFPVSYTGTPSAYVAGYGDGFVQYVTDYEEDGILFVFVLHNYFGDVGLSSTYRNKLPEYGGGNNEQYFDLYIYPIPDTTKQALAANSAPCRLIASCAGGVVSLSWADPPGGRTFRVYRGTTLASQTTLIGDVTGTSTTDSPTTGSVYYYKVVSLNGGVEQKSRVVSTYVS